MTAENQPTFEQALQQLERIVQEIEEGKLGLEESIARYEEGMQLLQRCREILARAEGRIQKLQQGADGAPQIEALDPQSSGEQR